MAEQTYRIKFYGCWRDQNKGDIPSRSGIYCVYECAYNAQYETFSPKKLIYIGESDNVHDRIANHEKYNKWKGYVHTGNELCFSFSDVPTNCRERCEAALIFQHKPPENTEYKDSYPFDRTAMNLSGRIALLTSAFTVNRT